MNEIKNGKLIVDGLTYKLVLDEPEVKEWKPRVGELCEFSDDIENYIIDYFLEYRKNCYIDRERVVWRHCRPIQDPNIIQMIPHDGGKCPVPGETMVLARIKDGLYLLKKACDFFWGKGTNIDAYAVLK